MSQKEKVLKHLQRPDYITPLEALREYGCFRLSAIIYVLRKEGYYIVTHIAKGRGKHWGVYYLKDKMFLSISEKDIAGKTETFITPVEIGVTFKCNGLKFVMHRNENGNDTVISEYLSGLTVPVPKDISVLGFCNYLKTSMAIKTYKETENYIRQRCFELGTLRHLQPM